MSNFWSTLEILLINCEFNLILTWPANCVIVSTAVATQGAIVLITDVRLYVPVVSLPTQDNAMLLQQLRSGFKRTINCNISQSKTGSLRQNQYLNYLINLSFQGVNRVFVSFENDVQRIVNKIYYSPNVEIKDCNIMIHRKNVFNQPVKMTKQYI